MFGRRNRFPYTARHLGHRVAWVLGQLRQVPCPLTRSSAIVFDDRMAELVDRQGLLHDLRTLERSINERWTDQREELRYVRIHLRRSAAPDAFGEFRAGYVEGSRPAPRIVEPAPRPLEH